MPRNFHRRVELMFPIEDPPLRARIIDRILAVVLSDNLKARELQSDGTYRRLKPKSGEPVIRCQSEFQNIAREHAEDVAIPQAIPAITGAM
jgi:polyphosphate kinase